MIATEKFPLAERLKMIDHIQARRYSKLGGPALDIATEGIIRHLRACEVAGEHDAIVDEAPAANGSAVQAHAAAPRERAFYLSRI